MKAVMTVFAVLEYVAEHQPIGVSELARAMDMPKSTAQRMLQTLRMVGWIRVRSIDDPRWILTPRVLSIGARVGDAEALQLVALEPMRIIAQKSGETVHLTVPDGAMMVVISKVPSVHAVQPLSRIGGRSPIHASASGKAVLATMPAHERASLLNGGLEALTDRTITDLARLEAELDQVRIHGWAANHEEYLAGVSSVGSAICVHGRPLGAISLSVPTTRMTPARTVQYGEMTTVAAREVARSLDGQAL